MANAKHSNGRLFRVLTESPIPVDKQYSIGFAGCDRQRNQQVKGKPAQTATAKKAAATQKESLQPIFRNKKPQKSVLADPCVLPHLSSSPDLRIISSA